MARPCGLWRRTGGGGGGGAGQRGVESQEEGMAMRWMEPVTLCAAAEPHTDMLHA